MKQGIAKFDFSYTFYLLYYLFYLSSVGSSSEGIS